MNTMIKRNLFAVVSALVLAGCGSNGDVMENAPVGSEIQLSDEQIRNSSIKWNVPEMRRVHEELNCSGRIDVPPQNLADLHSPLRAFVKEVNIIQGDHVHKGEILVSLSHPDFARIQREFLESNERLSQLERDFLRKKELRSDDAVSVREFELAESEFRIEKARAVGLKAELNGYGFSTDQLLRTGLIQESIFIRSPFDGFVATMNLNLGKLVQPDELLLQVVNDEHLHLELSVYSKDISRIQESDTVQFFLPGKDSVHQAMVYRIGKVVDPANGAVMIHAHLLHERGYIPGTQVNAIIYASAQESIALPPGAIVTEGGNAFVFVRTQKGFLQRPVSILRKSNEWVAVTGIDSGDSVVVSGAYYLLGVNSEE